MISYLLVYDDGQDQTWSCAYWGIKGNSKPIFHSVHSVILSKIEQHSKKPDETKDRIVELCRDIPQIELFTRQKRWLGFLGK